MRSMLRAQHGHVVATRSELLRCQHSVLCQTCPVRGVIGQDSENFHRAWSLLLGQPIMPPLQFAQHPCRSPAHVPRTM